MKRLLVLCLSVVMVLLMTVVGDLASAKPPEKKPGPAQDRILVKFIAGTTAEVINAIHQKHGGTVEDVIPGIDVQVVGIPLGKVAEKVIAYKGEAVVEFAEPDHAVKSRFIPNDPSFPLQWGMVKIKAPEAWDETKGSHRARIAFVDSGIDQNHEDLRGQVVANMIFRKKHPVANDVFGHGTFMAGIAAAKMNNKKGVAGLAPRADLLNAVVLEYEGSGFYSWVAKGIVWAANHRARVINLSLGGYEDSAVLRAAVDYAWDKGALLVAAAGNEDSDVPLYPAFYEKVIAVAGTDQDDARAPFSSYGAWVDIAAPAVGIFSTFPNHSSIMGDILGPNYGFWEGTSMSTAHVTGVAGLVIAEHPHWSNARVRARILASTDPTTGFSTPVGRINARKAVR